MRSHAPAAEHVESQTFRMKARAVLTSTAPGRMIWDGLRTAKQGVRDMEGRLLWLTGRRALLAAPPPLFIGGTGGSGTRLLAQIAERGGVFMGSHLNFAYDALHLIGPYLEKWSRYTENQGRFLSDHERVRMDYDLTVALIRHRKGILNPGALWGVKIPRIIFFLPHVYQLFPSMKFLHVVRDGRDMAFSTNRFQLKTVGDLYMQDLRTRLAGAPEPVRAISLWSRINLDAAHFGQTELGSRYLCVRFEDLCLHPLPSVQRVLEFLGNSRADVGLVAGAVKAPGSMGRWRNMCPHLLERMVTEGSEGLRAFGYTEP